MTIAEIQPYLHYVTAGITFACMWVWKTGAIRKILSANLSQLQTITDEKATALDRYKAEREAWANTEAVLKDMIATAIANNPTNEVTKDMAAKVLETDVTLARPLLNILISSLPHARS